MKKFLTVFFLGCLPIAALAALAPEENAKRLAQIDFNRDGTLDRNEVLWGLLNRAKGGALDFTVPPREVLTLDSFDFKTNQRFDTATCLEVLLFYHQLRDRIPHGEPFKFSEVDAQDDFMLKAIKSLPQPGTGGVAAAPKTKKSGRYYLRRSLDKLPATAGGMDALEKDSATSDKFVGDTALFSFGHAGNGGREVVATGLLAYEPVTDFEGRVLYTLNFSRINFVGAGTPSGSSSQFKDEANLAQFGATLEAWAGNFAKLPGPVNYLGSVVRLNGLWVTDWSFESKVPTAQLEWGLYNGYLGLGSVQDQRFENLYYELDLCAHADAGYVVSGGTWLKNQKKGDWPAHLGGKALLTLYPFPKLFAATPLLITLGYQEYDNLNSESNRIRDNTAQLSWYFRKPGSTPSDIGLALSINYENVKNVINMKNDHSTIFGLSAGF